MGPAQALRPRIVVRRSVAPQTPTKHRIKTNLPVSQRPVIVSICMAHRDARGSQARTVDCLSCQGLGVAALCCECGGAGCFITRSKREAELAHLPMIEPCNVCRGTGQLPIHRDLALRLGLLDE